MLLMAKVPLQRTAGGLQMEQQHQYVDQEKTKNHVYNNHKKVYAIKFQSVVAPNDEIANLFGTAEGKRDDSGILGD